MPLGTAANHQQQHHRPRATSSSSSHTPLGSYSIRNASNDSMKQAIAPQSDHQGHQPRGNALRSTSSSSSSAAKMTEPQRSSSRSASSQTQRPATIPDDDSLILNRPQRSARKSLRAIEAEEADALVPSRKRKSSVGTAESPTAAARIATSSSSMGAPSRPSPEQSRATRRSSAVHPNGILKSPSKTRKTPPTSISPSSAKKRASYADLTPPSSKGLSSNSNSRNLASSPISPGTFFDTRSRRSSANGPNVPLPPPDASDEEAPTRFASSSSADEGDESEVDEETQTVRRPSPPSTPPKSRQLRSRRSYGVEETSPASKESVSVAGSSRKPSSPSSTSSAPRQPTVNGGPERRGTRLSSRLSQSTTAAMLDEDSDEEMLEVETQAAPAKSSKRDKGKQKEVITISSDDQPEAAEDSEASDIDADTVVAAAETAIQAIASSSARRPRASLPATLPITRARAIASNSLATRPRRSTGSTGPTTGSMRELRDLLQPKQLATAVRTATRLRERRPAQPSSPASSDLTAAPSVEASSSSDEEGPATPASSSTPFKSRRATNNRSRNKTKVTFLSRGLYPKLGADSAAVLSLAINGRRATRTASASTSNKAQPAHGSQDSAFPLPIYYGADLLTDRREFELPTAMRNDAERLRAKRDATRKPAPYKHISRNQYVTRAKLKGEVPLCRCPKDGDCGDDCENRLLQFICDPKHCPCGDKCTNGNLGERPHAKCAVHWYGSRGFGLKTLEVIPEGGLVDEYRGEVINLQEAAKRVNAHYKDTGNFYFLDYDASAGEVLDGGLRGNITRFANHSCDPNCYIEKWLVCGTDEERTAEFQVGLFAARDLAAGEELTYDYGWSAFGAKQVANEADKRLPDACYCGAANCCGVMGGKKNANPATTSSSPAVAATASSSRLAAPAVRTTSKLGKRSRGGRNKRKRPRGAKSMVPSRTSRSSAPAASKPRISYNDAIFKAVAELEQIAITTLNLQGSTPRRQPAALRMTDASSSVTGSSDLDASDVSSPLATSPPSSSSSSGVRRSTRSRDDESQSPNKTLTAAVVAAAAKAATQTHTSAVVAAATKAAIEGRLIVERRDKTLTSAVVEAAKAAAQSRRPRPAASSAKQQQGSATTPAPNSRRKPSLPGALSPEAAEKLLASALQGSLPSASGQEVEAPGNFTSWLDVSDDEEDEQDAMEWQANPSVLQKTSINGPSRTASSATASVSSFDSGSTLADMLPSANGSRAANASSAMATTTPDGVTALRGQLREQDFPRGTQFFYINGKPVASGTVDTTSLKRNVYTGQEWEWIKDRARKLIEDSRKDLPVGIPVERIPSRAKRARLEEQDAEGPSDSDRDARFQAAAALSSLRNTRPADDDEESSGSAESDDDDDDEEPAEEEQDDVQDAPAEENTPQRRSSTRRSQRVTKVATTPRPTVATRATARGRLNGLKNAAAAAPKARQPRSFTVGPNGQRKFRYTSPSGIPAGINDVSNGVFIPHLPSDLVDQGVLSKVDARRARNAFLARVRRFVKRGVSHEKAVKRASRMGPRGGREDTPLDIAKAAANGSGKKTNGTSTKSTTSSSSRRRAVATTTSAPAASTSDRPSRALRRSSRR